LDWDKNSQYNNKDTSIDGNGATVFLLPTLVLEAIIIIF